MQVETAPASRPVTPIGVANDDFRTNPTSLLNGNFYLSLGVRALGGDFMLAALRAAQSDTNFTEETDPYGDHDRGFLTVHGIRVWWKIDCYERGSNYRFGSEDPTDPARTERVMTLFLPEED